MWMKRDWVTFGATSAVVCAAAMMAAMPGVLNAGDETPVGKIAVPTIYVNNCAVTATVPADDNVLGDSGGVTFIKAGKLPAMKVQVANDTDAPAKVHLRLVLDSTSASDRLSRVPRPVGPAWSQDYELSLKPREVQLLNVSPTVTVALRGSVRLTATETPTKEAPAPAARFGNTAVGLVTVVAGPLPPVAQAAAPTLVSHEL